MTPTEEAAIRERDLSKFGPPGYGDAGVTATQSEADRHQLLAALDASREREARLREAVTEAVRLIENDGRLPTVLDLGTALRALRAALDASREREARLRGCLEDVASHHNGEDGHDMNDRCWRGVYALLDPEPKP